MKAFCLEEKSKLGEKALDLESMRKASLEIKISLLQFHYQNTMKYKKQNKVVEAFGKYYHFLRLFYISLRTAICFSTSMSP